MPTWASWNLLAHEDASPRRLHQCQPLPETPTVDLRDRICPGDTDLLGAWSEPGCRYDQAGLGSLMKDVSVQSLHDDLANLRFLSLALHQDGRRTRRLLVPRPDPRIDVAIIAAGPDLDTETTALEELASQSLELGQWILSMSPN